MRYNIFNSIHKALKAISYETALEIQRTNFLDKEETASAVARLDQTLALLDLHIEHEGRYIHPLIDKFNIDLDRRFREKHIESKFLAQRVREATDSLLHAGSRENKVQKGKVISEAFETILSFNLTLFIKEEHILNEMLWSNYRDEEIRAVEQQIIATLPADILEFETTWIVRSLDNSEMGQWLADVRQSAPEYVFQSLLALAEKELSAGRFEKLLHSLSPQTADVQ